MRRAKLFEDQVAELNTRHPEVMPRTWMENKQSELEMPVEMIQALPDPVLLARLVKPGAQIAYIEHDRPRQQRVDDMGRVLPEVHRAHSAIDGVYLDPVRNQVVVTHGRNARPAKAEIAQSFAPEGVQFEVPEGEAGDANKGGLDMTSCTSGFSIIDSNNGNRFLVTAGHCGGQSYQRVGDSTWYPSVFAGAKYNKHGDIRWRTTTQHTPKPRFYYGNGTMVGKGEQVHGIGIAVVGSWLCHQGKRSGYGCGEARSIDFAPSHDGACPGVPCNPTLVRVKSQYLKNLEWDSGGPWFNGSHIYGVHSGQQDGSIPGKMSFFSKVTMLPDRFAVLTPWS